MTKADTNRAYYLRNREKLLTRAKSRNAINRVLKNFNKMCISDSVSYNIMKEKRASYNRLYYQKNREKLLTRAKSRNATNKVLNQIRVSEPASVTAKASLEFQPDTCFSQSDFDQKCVFMEDDDEEFWKEIDDSINNTHEKKPPPRRVLPDTVLHSFYDKE